MMAWSSAQPWSKSKTPKRHFYLENIVIAESKPVGFIIVILGVESATIHVQVVRVTITVGCGRPPVPDGVLAVQVTIAPVVLAREHIRKRIPTGFDGVGGNITGE